MTFTDNFSKNDLIQFNYFNQKLNQYVLTDAISSSYIKSVLTTTSIMNANNIPFSDANKLFYIVKQPSTIAVDVTYYTVLNSGQSGAYTCTITPVSINASTALSNIFTFVDKNFRLIFGSPVTPGQPKPTLITNLSYDIKYLSGQSFPTGFYIDSQLSVLLPTIAPSVYLELCTNITNYFFRTIFSNTVDLNGNVKTIGTTFDEINNFCRPTSTYDRVSDACAIEHDNPRCACKPCYSKHSSESRQIYNTLLNSGNVANNPWCYLPACASGMAYKDQMLQKRSTCSNISVSGIFLNPSEYSNIEISNTQVSASSSNDNAINIYGGWCQNCTEDQQCVATSDNQMKCVPKPKSQLNTPSKNDLTYSSNNHVRNWFIIGVLVLILITLLIYRFVLNFPKKLFNILIVSSISILIITIILIKNSTTGEKYSMPFQTCDQIANNLCYTNSTCVNGRQCINNICRCPIGTFLDGDTCADYVKNDTQFNYILTSFPYLPHSLYAGIYYYSTVINNTIYVFATSGNFKYNGDKWIEISRFSNQVGFNPSIPRVPMNDINCDTRYVLNTNMCCTNNNKVYIFLNKLSVISTVINDTTVAYLVYDTDSDTWSSIGLKTSLNSTSNCVVTVINNDIMYVFNCNKTDNSTNVGVINLNSGVVSINKLSQTVYFDDNSYAFVDNGNIWIGGASVSGTDGYSLSLFDIQTFTLQTKINSIRRIALSSLRNGPTGGVLPFYYKGIFYILDSYGVTNIDMSTANIANPYGKITGSPQMMFISLSSSLKTYVAPPCDMPFSAGNCTFIMNGYLFIITGSGEIFRGTFKPFNADYNINLIPCFGVSNFDGPIDNDIINM